ncbi:hypothetical protein [Actinoplanes sp. GCM10030250]|uniref:hypothetical protein n=1 Tax=Actinoplanes sp. GCM10030250 TaxID=3273376 RepID=UPI00361A094B
MIRRLLKTEMRRGTPPLTALLTATAMIWMLVVHPDDWVAKWGGLSAYLRVSLLILCPLLVAAGAWQAGRERRAQLEELLSTSPRPTWQPLLAASAAVTLGGLAGLVPPLAVAAMLVGLRSSYPGTGWWWTMLVGFIALVTASALGVLIGRLAPLRVVAPIAGLVVYLGLAVPIYLHESPWTRLSPVIGYAWAEDVWPVRFHAWQAGWLMTIAALLFLLAARHWWAAAVPAVLAAALLVVPARAGANFGEPGADPGATALACIDRVCVAQVNAFLLDDVAKVLGPGLDRLAEVPGGPVRAVDELARERDDDRTDVLWFSLLDQAKLTGGVAREDWLVSNLGSPFTTVDCWPDAGITADIPPSSPTDISAGIPAGVQDTVFAAEQWARGEPPAEVAALSENEQRKWVGAVLAATRACDQAALARLDLP